MGKLVRIRNFFLLPLVHIILVRKNDIDPKVHLKKNPYYSLRLLSDGNASSDNWKENEFLMKHKAIASNRNNNYGNKNDKSLLRQNAFEGIDKGRDIPNRISSRIIHYTNRNKLKWNFNHLQSLVKNEDIEQSKFLHFVRTSHWVDNKIDSEFPTTDETEEKTHYQNICEEQFFFHKNGPSKSRINHLQVQTKKWKDVIMSGAHELFGTLLFGKINDRRIGRYLQEDDNEEDDNEEDDNEEDDNEGEDIEGEDTEGIISGRNSYQLNSLEKDYQMKGMDSPPAEAIEKEDEEEEEEITLEVDPEDDDFDKITDSFKTTFKGEGLSLEQAVAESFASSNTNKEYVCDFKEYISPKESSKIVTCEMKIQEPLVKVKIICPTKDEEATKFKSIEYFPKKAPYVVLVNENKNGEETESLKEKKLAELVYGVVIPPQNNEKDNEFEKGSIEFILPPIMKSKKTLYYICDNSKSTDGGSNKGSRGITAISIEPYGEPVKGCNYSGKNKNFFTYNYDETASIGTPCVFQLNAGEIGGIMFPKDIKSTSCFDKMIPNTLNEKWDKKKKALIDVISGSVIYNKEMDAKYYDVKYFTIPQSYRDSINLFCHIKVGQENKVHMVYISINQELNMSIFNLYDSFSKIKKVSQIAKKTEGKTEYTCDFTDQLEKSLELNEKKVIICRKKLKEFDTFKMKCNVSKSKYANIEMIPKMLKDEKKKKNVLKIQLDVQYELFKRYLHFHTKNAEYLIGYPSFLMFPFNKIAKMELKKNSIFKSHKDFSYFDQVSTASDGLIKLLAYMDAQDTVVLKEKIPNLNISDEESNDEIFDLTFQVPAYVDISEPLYFFMGCNNTKDGGNIGVVELVISKNEQIVKGCNFAEGKIEYFTQNIASSENKCALEAYPNDVIGFNCSKITRADAEEESDEEDPVNNFVEPDGCFAHVYNESGGKTDINELLPGAQLYNIKKKKSRAFMKIPSIINKLSLSISCKCKVDSTVKEVNIKIVNGRTKTQKGLGVVDVKKEATTNSDDNIYTCPNKSIIEPKLAKWDDKYVKHTCQVDVKKENSYIELFCPSKDFSIHHNINMSYSTTKPQKEEQLKPFNQEVLEKLIPHSEILHKTKIMLPLTKTHEKENVDLSHIYLYFPQYVKEEHEFNIVCDNSNTFVDYKKGGTLSYQIKVPQRSKKVKGCDFTSTKSDIFLNTESANNCVIDALPNDIIGFVCPPDTVKITSCFRNAVVDEKLTNISDLLSLTDDNIANQTYTHNFNYIQVPNIISKDVSFKCICVNLKKDYQLKSPPSPKLLDVIYQKLNIKKADDALSLKADRKHKFLMSSMNMYLAHKTDKIASLFHKINEKKPAEEDANPEEIIEEIATSENYDDSTCPSCSIPQVLGGYTEEDYYSVLQNIHNESVEETITQEIASLIATDFKVYTLKINLKAPKLIEAKKVKEDAYVCDFSKKGLLLPEPLNEDIPSDIHCHSVLKPLDILYVKCPTEKAAYAIAKGKMEEDDDEGDKEITTLLDSVVQDGVSDASPLDDPSFVKYFSNYTIKPNNFFEKVLISEGTVEDKEEEIDTILPGALYTTMKVLKKKDPYTSYAAIVIPPSISKNTTFKVQCNNEGYKEASKYGGYKGIIHLSISKSEKKAIGCDFTSANSKLLTKGIELSTGQTKDCEIELKKNDIFGIRCNSDFTLDPEKCFHEIYNKSSEVKKISEVIPNVKIFTFPNSKSKIAYGKIPLDYVNKVNFSCSCKKPDGVTKGTMKVVVNNEEASLEDMKLVDAIKHENVNFCNFFDNEMLSFKQNADKNIQCKVEPELFSEVLVILPRLGSSNAGEADYKNFSVTPSLAVSEDIKVVLDDKNHVPLSTALKGVFGHRTFSFKKNDKNGIGFSFFIPPVFESINLKLIINQKEVLSSSKQRGVIFIVVRKNMDEGSLKMCDFTSSENSLSDLHGTNNEKVCNVKIKKGDVFGITCPKGFYLYPEACFSNVILDYYKGEVNVEAEQEEDASEGNDEDINYIEEAKTNLRLKDLLELVGENDIDISDLHNFYEFSNITEMLNFENFNLGSMPLDFKKNYTSSYAKAPAKFRSILKFSCNCYNPQKNVFGTMNVESEYTDVEKVGKPDEEKYVRTQLLPLRKKIKIEEESESEEEEADPFMQQDDSSTELVGGVGQWDQEETDNSSMLSDGISYTCDFSQENLFDLIEGKLQRNTCKINARAMDVVTIKCPPIKNHVHKETAVPERNEKEKVTITIDEEEYVTYQDEKTMKKTFSLKEIYNNEYYNMTTDEVKLLRKLDAEWDDNHIFYPKQVLENVIVENKIVKLKEALPGLIFLKSKVQDEMKSTNLITDGVTRFFIPPYVKDDFNFHIFCGKSSSKKPKRNDTSLGIVHVNISANRKELQGCDFVAPKGDVESSSIFTNKRDTSNDSICPISLTPNTVVGIRCPKKKLTPENCFQETYFIKEIQAGSTVDEFANLHKEKITDIIKDSIPIQNFENEENTYTYLILPKNMKHLETLDTQFYCTCDKNIVKMKIDEIYIKREKAERIDNETCTYDKVKNVTICNVVEYMESLSQKDNKTNHYKINLTGWSKLILKYPTNEKENYEKIFLNPFNIKEKVLFNKVPTDIEEILPGSITTNKVDSRTKIVEHTLRIPPYVHKSVQFSLEFNNSLSSKKVNYNYVYGNVIKIFIHVNEGYKEINGCDFTGYYNHLFSHTFDPNSKENITCKVTVGSKSFAGFACPPNFDVIPQNCFTSVYDNNDDDKVKKLVDLSEDAEHDSVHYNTRGFTLSYVTFKSAVKGQNISCKCVSPENVTYTINVAFDPDSSNAFPSTRIRIRYVDLKKGNFASYLRKR
ncbi:6-cysteine protein [Plasmodium gonderi]|uniref:6-cysteine protein n=1 Tax=Plasmodium gonderi TaxID=77519 RepID=A0A1Y1JE80_PLAGO|nr:6-cysteine protein [Plasmodium gonderi]GAW79517.1 6-cysteine protein [Plasmodium gonderi]